jgi:hypothetical protein
MNKKGTSRNVPCPCGSGKKYKHCCYKINFKIIPAVKKDATFSLDNGTTITRSVISSDSIPTHNQYGLRPNITKEQMMDCCLDKIHIILESEKVGMLADLVNRTVKNMDIIPSFTYREISNRMESDGRFEITQMQICGLKGTDPISLMLEKLEK